MVEKRLAIGVIATGAMLALALHAVTGTTTYHPTQTMAPKALSIPGAAIDVVGLVPGMGYAKASAILAGRFGSESLREEKRTLGAHRDGVGVASEPFVNTLWAQTTNSTAPVHDNIRLYFSGPASGHQLVGVNRLTIYEIGTEKPLVNDVVAKLVVKYGQPTKTLRAETSSMLQWAYDSDRLVPSDAWVDPANVYDPASMSSMLSAPVRARVVIAAIIMSDDREHGLVGSLSVTVGSPQLRAAIARADSKPVMDSLAAALKAPRTAQIPEL